EPNERVTFRFLPWRDCTSRSRPERRESYALNGSRKGTVSILGADQRHPLGDGDPLVGLESVRPDPAGIAAADVVPEPLAQRGNSRVEQRRLHGSGGRARLSRATPDRQLLDDAPHHVMDGTRAGGSGRV